MLKHQYEAMMPVLLADGTMSFNEVDFQLRHRDRKSSIEHGYYF
jgi:hypothetical protein